MCCRAGLASGADSNVKFTLPSGVGSSIAVRIGQEAISTCPIRQPLWSGCGSKERFVIRTYPDVLSVSASVTSCTGGNIRVAILIGAVAVAGLGAVVTQNCKNMIKFSMIHQSTCCYKTSATSVPPAPLVACLGGDPAQLLLITRSMPHPVPPVKEGLY